MADRILKPDSGNDLVLQNDDGSGKIEINENASIPVTGTLDVSGATLTTSSAQKEAIVQAGPGSGTLDVSSGTFTTSSAQKQAIVQAGPGSGTLDVSSGTFTTSSAQKQTIVDGATIEAQDLASGSGTTLPNNVQDAITRLGTVTSGTFNGSIGSSASFPYDGTTDAGRIIQIKNVTSQETNDLNTTYTVRWNYSITLKSSTSKVMVIHTENSYVVQPNGYGFKIYRDSSAINDSVTTVPSGANAAEVLNTTLADSSNKPHAMYIVSGDIYWMTTQHFLDDVSSNFNAGDTVYYGHFYRKYSTTTVQVPAAGSGGAAFFRTIIMEVQK